MAATGAGALVGGNVGYLRHVHREPMEGLDRLDAVRERIRNATQIEGADAADRIRRAVSARLRATRETPAQRHRRIFGSARGAAAEQGPFVIGNPNNLTEVYDLQLDRRRRQLHSDEILIDRLEAKDNAAFEGTGEPLTREEAQTLSRVRSSAAAHRAEIGRLQRFKDAAHARIVVDAHRREKTEVPPHVRRQFRRGETLEQIGERQAEERRRLRNPQDPKAVESKLLAAVQQRTERRLRTRIPRGLAEEAAAIERGLRAGRFRATGKGALLGAGLGFTAAGLGILAHHFASAIHRNTSSQNSSRTAEKQEPIGNLEPLAKLARSRTQDSIAAGLARTYRDWIDRLLGRTEQPMQMGDDLAHAMAPGLATAFAQGAANPPVDSTGSDPRWRIDVDFDKLNSAQRRHMVEYALDRIVSITEQQRDAIRSALLNQTVLQGLGPPTVARSIREAIGLTPYQQDVVRSFRAQLENLDVAALERKLRDRRYDRTLRRAIESQEPLSDEQIDAMVDAYHRRMLTLRATTIARTESIRATTQGALARAQEVLDQHPELDVLKIWHSTHDDRTRPTHVDLDGHQVQGMLTPFVTSSGAMIRWPVDDQAPADEAINCRCYLEYRFIPRRGQLVAV